jgi:microcystin degradation protein MlrC
MHAVLLALHGAMVTESDDDAEGLVLQRVRDRVGKDIPVVVTLDLHAHVTQRMVDHATALVIYKTCAHVHGDSQSPCVFHEVYTCRVACMLLQTRTLTAELEQLRQCE